MLPWSRPSSRLAAAGVAGLLVAGFGVALSARAATAGCSVAYTITSQWPGGFGANVSVTNLGDPVTGWTLAWSYAAGQKVTQAWNATVSQSGAQVTARNAAYNAAVATNASVAFGFNGSWTGSNPVPAAFTLNGVTCTGSVTGSPTPTTPTPTSTSTPTPTLTTSPPPTTTPPPSGGDDWPTYHRDNARDGNAPNLAPLSQLSVAWNAALDGAVYGQPLVVGGRILAATENDTVYSLDPATGAVVWSAHVGQPEPLSDLPCGDIDPLGITSTMVYDPATNRVFAVAETAGGAHTLVGINAGTGAVEVRAAVEPPLGDLKAHQQRGALTLFNGRVYIGYGGLFGDCGQYVGSVVSVTTAGTGKQSYSVPTTREAGIWGTAGGVVDGDHLLYAVGNGESTSTYDGSDSTLALSADLQRTDFFAPSDWATQNAGDEDLGSMTPALVGQYVYADGKAGIGYVLSRTHLGGVGGQVSQLNNGCDAFGASAVSGSTIYLPCTTGPRAVTVAADGTAKELWRASNSVPAEGSPAIGGGAVWVVDYFGGVLYALDPATGSVLAQVRVGHAPNFVSPTLSGNRAYVGTTAGVTAVNGA